MISALALTLSIFSQPATDGSTKFKGLGPHRRHISTRSADAEEFFNEGLEFMYGFNKAESARLFQEASRLDPDCAMAYWGIASANGPDINNPGMDPDQTKAAFEAIRKAKSLESKASPVERALIEAASARFGRTPVQDRSALDLAYANEMRKVWRAYPRDADVGALFAESLMDLRPWHQWKLSGVPEPGTLEILATCRAVLKLEPNHPQALHMLIHASEASPHPEQALEAANKLAVLQPGLGHMVHMPSHIYVRTGHWQESVEANERAIKVDLAYRKKRNKMTMYRFYMLHNWHMLGYSAMMIGESKKALNAMDSMFAPLSDQKMKELAGLIDSYVPMPLEARIRFGKWDEILATPEYPDYFPVARTIQHFARGVAYAAKGEVAEARNEQDQFEFCAASLTGQESFGMNQASTVVDLARHMLAGEIAFADKKLDTAISELNSAVKTDDAMMYDEPPGWIMPPRHALGAILVKAGRFAEAEQVYRDDLKKLPNNGWSLFGLSQALASEKKSTESAHFQQLFAASWRKADVSITSSCMCSKK